MKRGVTLCSWNAARNLPCTRDVAHQNGWEVTRAPKDVYDMGCSVDGRLLVFAMSLGCVRTSPRLSSPCAVPRSGVPSCSSLSLPPRLLSLCPLPSPPLPHPASSPRCSTVQERRGRRLFSGPHALRARVCAVRDAPACCAAGGRRGEA